ncbi:hypothetical protein BCR33DRAFT_718234 [Rhizoclosmatium globosum]|uniref:Uncharacterized protein n=1 Tax=Rhizoclosmatium globosum TaxID=329046 RepID=A0A1Y2C671_9FUNG|nr:hypothetical protein BCR33DRAFT_718220 [Rhizoclosmatium globosum]ORY42540.1 hypothetical protein BCR33DRAFT_718234 [Rhizoclosmatium globosum]|eukprot:ORY42528.1 hypothetical protein BCR33DRAFT_718220 [Rhizoclosmatium globosum]
MVHVALILQDVLDATNMVQIWEQQESQPQGFQSELVQNLPMDCNYPAYYLTPPPPPSILEE